MLPKTKMNVNRKRTFFGVIAVSFLILVIVLVALGVSGKLFPGTPGSDTVKRSGSNGRRQSKKGTGSSLPQSSSSASDPEKLTHKGSSTSALAPPSGQQSSQAEPVGDVAEGRVNEGAESVDSIKQKATLSATAFDTVPWVSWSPPRDQSGDVPPGIGAASSKVPDVNIIDTVQCLLGESHYASKTNQYQQLFAILRFGWRDSTEAQIAFKEIEIYGNMDIQWKNLRATATDGRRITTDNLTIIRKVSISDPEWWEGSLQFKKLIEQFRNFGFTFIEDIASGERSFLEKCNVGPDKLDTVWYLVKDLR